MVDTALSKMSDLEKIKQIAEQMPDSLEKKSALQAYSNLKMFEVIADSFEELISCVAPRNNTYEQIDKEK